MAKKKTTKKMGRPKKVDLYELAPKEKLEKLFKALRIGNYLKDAANHARLRPETVYQWMHWGRSGKGPAYETFVEKVEGAIADCKNMHISVVTKAAHEGDWRASQYFLSVTDGKRWGKKETVKIEDNDTKDSNLDPEAINDYISKRSKQLEDGFED